MAGKTYNVIDYQAVGDGVTDDTQVDGNITAPNYIWTTEMTNLITFHAISNLVFHGTGTIDGRAPGNSPNTDGIVMQDCQNVQITGCIIGTGDDCIAVLTNTSNVNISRIRCGPGHGISIGSLGKDNTNAAVERIHIHDSTIYNALTGARIKTWQGGSGYARNITFERISMANVTTPIVIDQTYNTLQVSTDVAISNIVFRNIHGTSTHEVAIKLDCSAIVPCKELIFDEITLTRIGVNQTVFAASQNAYGMTNGTIIPSLHLG
ncbi:hypothetical protein LUZ61_004930 [Rhynchospora tenuis]|uniref:Polygalacturonase n=1 Tax=Rhynchospora tenuis TaxID=198213 RepID=A0AAD5ZNN1_9POAL|nr:hypothetical protein LUZ61_004930 [Rhynchospora tenuis]